ncbi:MAG TPA: chemotaxis protein CheX [Opitutaceae bacterium]|nr:chemotaxis protein CheX [Opitutaceae bacterium]
MDEAILRVFSVCAAGYFTRVALGPATVGTPYLQSDGDSVAADFTAVIGITGKRRGVVCFAAPRALLQALLPAMGEANGTDALCADLAGEIANTLAGNARAELGATFMISVPVVIAAPQPVPTFPRDSICYVLPLVWQGHRAAVWVALHQADETP